jgi:hypothetical protein
MNPHPVPEHLDKFHPPLLAQLDMDESKMSPPPSPPPPSSTCSAHHHHHHHHGFLMNSVKSATKVGRILSVPSLFSSSLPCLLCHFHARSHSHTERSFSLLVNLSHPARKC